MPPSQKSTRTTQNENDFLLDFKIAYTEFLKVRLMNDWLIGR